MPRHIWPTPDPDQSPGGVRCSICKQRRDNAEVACPRTRDWRIASRQPRAIRAAIERCGTCGFRDDDERAGGAIYGRCAHPALTVSKLISRADLVSRTAPADCPGRGVVVMIGGPPPLEVSA